MTNTQLQDKIFKIENQVQKANTIFSELFGGYLSKSKYDMRSEDEDEVFDAYALLENYPNWSKLLEIAYDYTINARNELKALSKQI